MASERRQDSFEEALVMGSRMVMPSPPKDHGSEIRTFKPGQKTLDISRARTAEAVKVPSQPPTIATFVPTEEDEESAPSLQPIYRSDPVHMGERPLPEDDGAFFSPDAKFLEASAPALAGAGNRELQQNTRFQMKKEEQLQTREDRFWGLDTEAANQVRDSGLMAGADDHSFALREKEKNAQQHAEWEQAGRERRDEMQRRIDAETEEARKAYMRLFHEAETSDEVMDYRWPTQPSLEPYFGKVDRKDWWPLDKPLNPDQRHTFHAVRGQRRHDVTQLHVDEFAKAAEELRTMSENAIPQPGGRSLSSSSTVSATAPLLSVPPSTPGGTQLRTTSKVSLAPIDKTAAVAAGNSGHHHSKPEKPYSGGLLRGTPVEMMSKADIRTYERLGWRVKQADARRLGLVTKANSPTPPVSPLGMHAHNAAGLPSASLESSLKSAPPLLDPSFEESVRNPTTIAPSRPESVHESINAIKKPFTEITAATYVGVPKNAAEEETWRAFFQHAANAAATAADGAGEQEQPPAPATTVHGADLARLLSLDKSGGVVDAALKSFTKASLTLRAIREEDAIRDSLADLETEDPSGFSVDEWVVFCDYVSDLSGWNEFGH